MDLSTSLIDSDIDSDSDPDTRAQDAPPIDRESLLRELVTEHRGRLRRFVLRHIGHPDDANDIAQQAFFEAARTIQKFRGESELSTWLYGIAMNLVRNYINRAPHRVHRFESDAVLADVAAASPDPSDTAARVETIRFVERAMSELPREMSQLLMLVAVNELSYEDAARILSVPIGTVRSRLCRARCALKAKMEAAGMALTF
jgi:RNA polymerase sigma-70 factor (ECF subfamily)